MSIRLGYACINLALYNKTGATTSRTATRKTIMSYKREDAVVMLKKLAMENLRDLLAILQWNVEHKIYLFRITSNLFPHMGDRELQKWYPESLYFRGDIRFAAKALETIGKYARDNDIRLTFHSNPYCQIAATDREVLRATVFDLGLYYKILNALGVVGKGGCLILHGGGHYGDKPSAIKRLETRLTALPKHIRDIVAMENDERMYGVDDLLPICERLGVYFCFDVFHNSIYPQPVRITRELMQRVCKTWTRRGAVPKFHLSQQLRGEREGAHSKNVTEVPKWMFGIAKLCGLKFIDLMIEAKNKDVAVMKLFKLYGGVDGKIDGKIDGKTR